VGCRPRRADSGSRARLMRRVECCGLGDVHRARACSIETCRKNHMVMMSGSTRGAALLPQAEQAGARRQRTAYATQRTTFATYATQRNIKHTQHTQRDTHPTAAPHRRTARDAPRRRRTAPARTPRVASRRRQRLLLRLRRAAGNHVNSMTPAHPRLQREASTQPASLEGFAAS
jgi:hypothetical protein